MSDRIACDVAGGVADVRMTRADKMNALDEAMFLALLDLGERLRGEKGLRAVVLSGEGRAFCAGLDMASFARMAASGGESREDRLGLRTLAARTHGLANSVQQVAWQWRELPVPVIAAVHGVAFGAGFQIALGADIRFAAPGTKFSVMEIKWGLVPDMAGTMLMRHLARDDVVRDLTYTGRVFTAEEALGYGFATGLADDPRAAAFKTAQEIAAKNPDAVRAAKRLLNAAPTADVAAGLLAESIEQQALIGSPNQLEAVMANLGKREPRFLE
jgi:enoyl-CoA hydratase/carnithine racemase